MDTTSYNMSIQVAIPQGVDPALIANIVRLCATEVADIAARDWVGAITTGIQIAGAIAAIFSPPPGPTPSPVPTPVPVPGK